jgi:hypothetical protein
MAQVRRATLGAAFGQPGMNIVVVYAIVLAACIAASLLFPTQFRFLTYPNLPQR